MTPVDEGDSEEIVQKVQVYHSFEIPSSDEIAQREGESSFVAVKKQNQGRINFRYRSPTTTMTLGSDAIFFLFPYCYALTETSGNPSWKLKYFDRYIVENDGRKRLLQWQRGYKSEGRIALPSELTSDPIPPTKGAYDCVLENCNAASCLYCDLFNTLEILK